jgi:hypothetical protein
MQLMEASTAPVQPQPSLLEFDSRALPYKKLEADRCVSRADKRLNRKANFLRPDMW